MKRPRQLRFNKWKRAYACDADFCYGDGRKYSWPRAVMIDTDGGLTAKQTVKLMKWLRQVQPWLEEK